MKNPHVLIACALVAFVLLKMVNLAALKLADYLLLSLAAAHLALSALGMLRGGPRRFR